MLYYLIMCRSVTIAQRTARRLERAGLRCSVIRAPYSLSDDGCGYCVKLSGSIYKRAMTLLNGTELQPRRVFRAVGQGSYEEVVDD